MSALLGSRRRRHLLLRRRGGFVDPTSVTGLALWLKADVGVYQEIDSKTTASGNGDNVGTWEDQSGNGNDLSADTEVTRPNLVTNQINSLPIIRFTNANQDKLRRVFALSQPYTVYMVLKQTAWTPNARVCAGGSTEAVVVFQKGVSPQLKLYAGTGEACTNGDLSLNTVGILQAIFNGASSSLRIGSGTAQTGNPGSGNPGGFSVSSSSAAQMDVGEVLVYNSAISGGDDANIMNYLSGRWTNP